MTDPGGQTVSRSTRLTRFALSDPRWHAFVDGHPDATPLHRPAWTALVADCYGFRAFVAALTGEGGGIRAGLPLIEVRHGPTRPRWVALPFTDYCPPLLADRADGRPFAQALRSAATARGVSSVEVRGPLDGAEPMGIGAFRHVLALDPDPDVVATGFHKSQVLRNIRRAERESLTLRVGREATDVLDVFYRLHLGTRRRQGVPIQPRRFFRLLWERIIAPGDGEVVVVEAARRPIAAAVFLRSNGTVVYKFGASEADAWSLRPNHLLFWHVIQQACLQRYRWFDFGRTDADGEGLRAFKRSWGALEEPLVHHGFGGRGRDVTSTDGRASRLVGAVIRRAPASVCRASGELFYRFTA